MRVAIIHYWLVGMRGGERVLEALLNLYPDADIFTHVYAPDRVSNIIKQHKIYTSFIQRLPYPRRLYQNYLPLMPLALEELDLREYDLVISSESGPAKGVIPSPNALHICYCHSPMRYIWNMYHEYSSTTGGLKRALIRPVSHYIRNWDVSSASRVQYFLANSRNVAKRVRTYYSRDAKILYPPVDCKLFGQSRSEQEAGDFYLMAGELVSYKRPDLAVEAFNRSGRRLVIIGGGPMLQEVYENANKRNILVLGPQPLTVLKEHYRKCRALVFPGDEDFGMVPVEAMCSGAPVIAFGRGGALETVEEGVSGLFFREQTVDALNDVIDRFEATTFDPALIRSRAERFDTAVFSRGFAAFVKQKLESEAAWVH